jgi:hypothetical protein
MVAYDDESPLRGDEDATEANVSPARRSEMSKQLSQAVRASPNDMVGIPVSRRSPVLLRNHRPPQGSALTMTSGFIRITQDDVYSMLFLSSYGGPAFWYAGYVTFLKMALYTFLMIDAVDQPIPTDVDRKVLAAQFLMLPIAVAIQEDLTAFFFTVANVHYSHEIQGAFPDATCSKFYLANAFRGFDGCFSLAVNVVILLKANSVLALFLNFAALQFLQTIDNIALHLCLDGYLFDRLEQIAHQVMQVRLPRRVDSSHNTLDSLFFFLSFMGILVAWVVFHFA